MPNSYCPFYIISSFANSIENSTRNIQYENRFFQRTSLYQHIKNHCFSMKKVEEMIGSGVKYKNVECYSSLSYNKRDIATCSFRWHSSHRREFLQYLLLFGKQSAQIRFLEVFSQRKSKEDSRCSQSEYTHSQISNAMFKFLIYSVPTRSFSTPPVHVMRCYIAGYYLKKITSVWGGGDELYKP